MGKFVEFTVDNEKVLMNTDFISSVNPDKNGCIILIKNTSNGSDRYVVSETYDKVKKVLNT